MEKFICPICSCQEYSIITLGDNNIIGPARRIDVRICFCLECSAIFLSPKNFNKDRVDKYKKNRKKED